MFGFGKKKDPEEAPAAGWLARLQQGLGKTRAQLGASLGSLFGAGRKLDEAFYEELETVLLTADVGVAATIHLLDAHDADVIPKPRSCAMACAKNCAPCLKSSPDRSKPVLPNLL
jgi:signal recognition particle GTPase